VNAVEFETSIENGIVKIPKEYQKVLNEKKVQIFIIPTHESTRKIFNPREFYGVTHSSKKEIDTYLNHSKDEWESHTDE
jgi:hypothetical protein